MAHINPEWEKLGPEAARPRHNDQGKGGGGMKKAALLAFVFVWTLAFFLVWQSFEGELPALIKVQLCLFYAVGFMRAAYIYELACSKNTLPRPAKRNRTTLYAQTPLVPPDKARR